MRSPWSALGNDWRAARRRWRGAPADLGFRDVIPALPPPVTLLLAALLCAWMRFANVNLHRRNEALFQLAYESSVSQLATALFFFLAGVGALLVSARSFRRPITAGPRRWWVLALGLGCILIAAEEASWGQTYLGYGTPAFAAPHNVQSEFNLHNLEIPGLQPYWANDVHWLLTAAIGAVLPLLLVASRTVARAAWALQVPVPPWLTMAACFFAAILLPTDADLIRQWGPPFNVASELREVTVAAAVLPWVWTAGRESRRRVPDGSNLP